MDTRYKILSWAQAVERFRRLAPGRSRLVLVRGYFDPLLAAHLRRLRELAGPDGKVLVLLANPERPILSARARAELVAGLRIVESVVLPPEAGEEIQWPADVDIRHEEAGDIRRRQALIRHVHECQAG